MADPKFKVELITRDFNRMLAELAAIDVRVEFRDVVKSEALSVTQAALSRTKAAKVSDIRADHKTKKYTTFNGKTYNLEHRLPNDVWNGIKAKRQEQLQVKLNARGIGKQSWIWVAGAIGGGRLKAPAYVQNANYKGRQYNDGAASETGSLDAYQLTIVNVSPVAGPFAGGERALLSAIVGRTRYFERNMENQAFRTLESRVKKYPGIFITR